MKTATNMENMPKSKESNQEEKVEKDKKILENLAEFIRKNKEIVVNSSELSEQEKEKLSPGLCVFGEVSFKKQEIFFVDKNFNIARFEMPWKPEEIEKLFDFLSKEELDNFYPASEIPERLVDLGFNIDMMRTQYGYSDIINSIIKKYKKEEKPKLEPKVENKRVEFDF